MSATAVIGLIDAIPGLWGFALGALALILSALSVMRLSDNRTRVALARIEAEHAARMYALETDREQKAAEARLEREVRLQQGPVQIEFPLRIERARRAAPAAEAAQLPRSASFDPARSEEPSPVYD